MTTITPAQLRKARVAARKALPDTSAAHRAALEALRAACPGLTPAEGDGAACRAMAVLAQDMAWQAVLAAR